MGTFTIESRFSSAKLRSLFRRIRNPPVHVAQRGLVHLRGQVTGHGERLSAGENDVFGEDAGGEREEEREEKREFHGRGDGDRNSRRQIARPATRKLLPSGLLLHMKTSLPFVFALLGSFTLPLAAEDAKPLLNQPGKVIAEPSFKEPVAAPWSIGKGTWTAADGVITAADVPEEKHIPVLHLATGPTPLIWECEFKFNAGKSFLVGCDGQSHHCGRVVIGPKSFKVCEDSTEVKGKTPSHTLSEIAVDLKPDEWHKVRVEFANDELAARLDGQDLIGQDPHLTMPKVRWWFAAAQGVQIRNVHITEGQPISPAPAPNHPPAVPTPAAPDAAPAK